MIFANKINFENYRKNETRVSVNDLSKIMCKIIPSYVKTLRVYMMLAKTCSKHHSVIKLIKIQEKLETI